MTNEHRTRFAWLPARLFALTPAGDRGLRHVVQPCGWVWLRPVTETPTAAGWLAYLHHQP